MPSMALFAAISMTDYCPVIYAPRHRTGLRAHATAPSGRVIQGERISPPVGIAATAA
jgi:hypothetical protein